MSEHRILFTLFGLNRAGKILYAILILLAGPVLITWLDVIPRMRFHESDELLFRAARHGDVAAITQALDSGGNVNAVAPVDHKTAVFRAAVFGHAEAVNALIAHGADLEARGYDGLTVLEVVTAARGDEKDAAKLQGLDAVIAVLNKAEGGR